MARKRKLVPFRAAKAVKALARETIGSPPPTRVVPEKTKKKQARYKPTLNELLRED